MIVPTTKINLTDWLTCGTETLAIDPPSDDDDISYLCTNNVQHANNINATKHGLDDFLDIKIDKWVQYDLVVAFNLPWTFNIEEWTLDNKYTLFFELVIYSMVVHSW